MRKTFYALLVAALGTGVAYSEDYDRVAASFDCSFLSPNQEYKKISSTDETLHMFGGGFNYVHGFQLSDISFIETGISIIGQSGKSEDLTTEKGWTYSEKFTNCNLQVPFNLVYRIPLTNNLSLSAFAGLVGKCNLSYKVKTSVRGDGVPGGKYSHSLNLLDGSSEGMNENKVWHRWQAAWQVGVGLNIRQIYVGVSGGTDFVPVYSHRGTKGRINSAGVKVTVGYTFHIDWRSLFSKPASSHPKSMVVPKPLAD